MDSIPLIILFTIPLIVDQIPSHMLVNFSLTTVNADTTLSLIVVTTVTTVFLIVSQFFTHSTITAISAAIAAITNVIGLVSIDNAILNAEVATVAAVVATVCAIVATLSATFTAVVATHLQLALLTPLYHLEY